MSLKKDLILTVNDIVGLQDLFPSCAVSHIGRLANDFAHNLTRFSKESEDYSCWVGFAPNLSYNIHI